MPSILCLPHVARNDSFGYHPVIKNLYLRKNAWGIPTRYEAEGSAAVGRDSVLPNNDRDVPPRNVATPWSLSP